MVSMTHTHQNSLTQPIYTSVARFCMHDTALCEYTNMSTRGRWHMNPTTIYRIETKQALSSVFHCIKNKQRIHSHYTVLGGKKKPCVINYKPSQCTLKGFLVAFSLVNNAAPCMKYAHNSTNCKLRKGDTLAFIWPITVLHHLHRACIDILHN